MKFATSPLMILDAPMLLVTRGYTGARLVAGLIVDAITPSVTGITSLAQARGPSPMLDLWLQHACRLFWTIHTIAKLPLALGGIGVGSHRREGKAA